MLGLFQLLFTLFALVAIWGVKKRYTEGLLGPKGAAFWVLFWLGAMGVVIVPESASSVAEAFGIGRGVDFIIYVAIAALFLLLFRLHIKLESLQRSLTKLVREHALAEVEKNGSTEDRTKSA